MKIGNLLSEGELGKLADDILEFVDYDIFKEDLEERVILAHIYYLISETVVNFEE